MKEYFPQDISARMPDGTVVPMMQNDFEDGCLRFAEESEILFHLGGLPRNGVNQILNSTDYFRANGTRYWVMDYIDGISIYSMIRLHSCGIPWKNALYLAGELCDVLEELHTGYDLFHLDIGPDHVMITKDFHAVLTGFGNLSKLGERRDSRTIYDCWEPPFTMPPEQGVSHMAKGAYSDVYSLAAVVFYLMTGRTIPRFTERLREQNSVVSLQEIKPEIPQRVSDALIHALEFKVPQRTQSMKQFKEELGVEWFLAEQETSPQYTIMNWDGS